jgi:hypothetical protein
MKPEGNEAMKQRDYKTEHARRRELAQLRGLTPAHARGAIKLPAGFARGGASQAPKAPANENRSNNGEAPSKCKGRETGCSPIQTQSPLATCGHVRGWRGRFVFGAAQSGGRDGGCGDGRGGRWK